MTLARKITGGWSGGDTMARQEWSDDGTRSYGFHGLVNACLSGDQCEGHACYCSDPASGMRKCSRVGWGRKPEPNDEKVYHPCQFKPNPYYRGDMASTYAALKADGKTMEVDSDHNPHPLGQLLPPSPADGTSAEGTAK